MPFGTEPVRPVVDVVGADRRRGRRAEAPLVFISIADRVEQTGRVLSRVGTVAAAVACVGAHPQRR